MAFSIVRLASMYLFAYMMGLHKYHDWNSLHKYVIIIIANYTRSKPLFFTFLSRLIHFVLTDVCILVDLLSIIECS